MAVDDAALDRLREDLLVAIRAAILDSEHRVRGEIADAVSASEHRIRKELTATAAETRRHMGVVAEDLTSKIALVAEGVITLTERLGADMRDGFDILDRRLLRLETRLLSSPERS